MVLIIQNRAFRLIHKLSAIEFEYAEGDQQSLGGHVVIERGHRFGSAGLAAPRKFVDFDFGLGIEGNPQGVRLVRGAAAGFAEVLEDGVGFGNFFSGRAFWTRRRR